MTSRHTDIVVLLSDLVAHLRRAFKCAVKGRLIDRILDFEVTTSSTIGRSRSMASLAFFVAYFTFLCRGRVSDVSVGETVRYAFSVLFEIGACFAEGETVTDASLALLIATLANLNEIENIYQS